MRNGYRLLYGFEDITRTDLILAWRGLFMFALLFLMVQSDQAQTFRYDDAQVTVKTRSGASAASTSTQRLGADWFLYGIEGGERGNRPCILKMKWWRKPSQGQSETTSTTWSVPNCNDSTNTEKSAVLENAPSRFSGVDGIRVCNRGNSNARLKGIQVFGSRRKANDFEEEGSDYYSRTNCGEWSDTVSACTSGEWAVGLTVHYTDHSAKGLALHCAPVLYEPVQITARLRPSRTLPQVDEGKKASVIFFHFGDSKFRTLFQSSQINLMNVIDPYDRTILLAHDEMPNWGDGNGQARQNADEVLVPTFANFASSLRRLARDGYMIDIYIFAHGSANGSTSVGFTGTNGQFEDDVYIRPDMIGQLAGGQESYTGFTRLPIRMVYQMNCYGSTLNDEWAAIGAKASMGSRFVRFNTNTFNNFANAWVGGTRFDDAVEGMDSGSAWTIMEALLLGDAFTSSKGATNYGRSWNGCPLGRTVLSGHGCAKDYFIVSWSEGAHEWSDDIDNGAQFIRNSSISIIEGDAGLRFSDQPNWLIEPRRRSRR